MLPSCCKFLRIFMIVNLLHSASSAILDVLSDWLSIMSRMRCSWMVGVSELFCEVIMRFQRDRRVKMPPVWSGRYGREIPLYGIYE